MCSLNVMGAVLALVQDFMSVVSRVSAPAFYCSGSCRFCQCLVLMGLDFEKDVLYWTI